MNGFGRPSLSNIAFTVSAEEEMLEEWITHMCKIGYGRTRDQLTLDMTGGGPERAFAGVSLFNLLCWVPISY